MNDKPIYPFAQGQVFQNLSFRTTSSITSSHHQRKKFIAESLNLRNSKYFYIDKVAEALMFCDRPFASCNTYRKGLRPNFCGYPIHPKITQKLFEHTKPAGHWFSKFDDAIVKTLSQTPFIPFLVTKKIKSLMSTGITIPNGNYFSIGGVTNTADQRQTTPTPVSLGADFSAIKVMGGEQYIFELRDHRFSRDHFMAKDIFIPNRAFSNHQQVGLTILPNDSIVWLWHDGKWKTCTVNTTQCDKTFKCCTKFIEVGLDESFRPKELLSLLEISGTELNNHKAISDLIDKDDLRIAVRSMVDVLQNTGITHARAHLVKTLAQNFSSEFLEPYKMRLLKATDYKNMSSFNEFALAMVKKFPPLTGQFLSKPSMSIISEYAILAAKDETPFLWGLEESLRSPLLQPLKAALITAGFDVETNHHSSLAMNVYHLHHFGLGTKDIKHESRKTVKVNFTAIVQKPVNHVYSVKPADDVEICVPNFIINKGKEFVKRYVKETLDVLEQEYQLQNYKTLENSNKYNALSSGKVKFSVDLGTIQIK